MLSERRRQATRRTRSCSTWCCGATSGRTSAGRWAASLHRQELYDTSSIGSAICSRRTAERRFWLHTEGLKSGAARQACHASTAALWQSRDSDATERYCAAGRLDHMRKVMPAPEPTLDIPACPRKRAVHVRRFSSVALRWINLAGCNCLKQRPPALADDAT